MATKEEQLTANSVNREGEAFERGLSQSVHQDNRDIVYNGRIRLRNHTTAPTKGRKGEIIMLSGNLSEWNETSGTWETVGDSPSNNVSHSVETTIISDGFVNGNDGTSGTPFPTGWTSSRTSEGVYVITHNIGSTSGYTVVATVCDATQSDRIVVERDPNSFDVETTDETGAAHDADFTFIVVDHS